MRQSPYIAIIIFSFIILLIDLYAYSGLKKIKLNLTELVRKILTITFWIVPLALIVSQYFVFTNGDPLTRMVYFHYFSGVLLLFYIPKLLFIFFNLADDIYHLGKFFFLKFRNRVISDSKGEKITRSTFLSRIGVIIAGIPFISIIYGIGWGKYNFMIRKSNLNYPNLPNEFDGFKIAQISDFHLGSFVEKVDKIEEIVDLVNAQNPDMIVFTGDLVNNIAAEVNPFITAISKLKAKYGKFSILGNHDYGEYVRWQTDKEKNENLAKLIENQEVMGFKMLMNSREEIKVGEDSISIIGIENWGLPPFPQYGDLKKAMEGIDNSAFKVLLSHDPTHWDEQVVGHTNIDLTLAGHTHGAQFGIEIPGWRWSPVNIRYKQWGGIYKEKGQILNVNTGIGFIGFPGRIGMPPEIGLLTLKKA